VEYHGATLNTIGEGNGWRGKSVLEVEERPLDIGSFVLIYVGISKQLFKTCEMTTCTD
jgi:hypothetical protein